MLIDLQNNEDMETSMLLQMNRSPSAHAAYVPIVGTSQAEISVMNQKNAQSLFGIGLLCTTYGTKKLNYSYNNRGYSMAKSTADPRTLCEKLWDMVIASNITADKVNMILGALSGYHDIKGLYSDIDKKSYHDYFRSVLNPLFYMERTESIYVTDPNMSILVWFDNFHLRLMNEQINTTEELVLWQHVVFNVRIGVAMYRLLNDRKIRTSTISRILFFMITLSDYMKNTYYN